MTNVQNRCSLNLASTQDSVDHSVKSVIHRVRDSAGVAVTANAKTVRNYKIS